MRVLLIIVTVLVFQSCSQEPKIVITKDFIINRHWNDYNNAILVERLKIKKGVVLDIFSPNFEEESNWSLNDKLKVDSTFMYSYCGTGGNLTEFDVNMAKESFKENKSKLLKDGVNVDSLINSIKINTDSRKKLEGKLYFNKANGFNWNFGNTYFGHKKTKKNVIGRLENNTWYKFSDLRPIAYYVYIYIDSTGEVHRFNVNMANF